MIMKTYDGGPAFPQERTLPCGSHEECEGLSMRDYFAAKALQSFMLVYGQNNGHLMGMDDDTLAQAAYSTADAMIKARAQ